MRAALGAGRRRLLQMLLVEGLLLTAAGGVLGLFIGIAVVRAMPDVITLSLPGVRTCRLMCASCSSRSRCRRSPPSSSDCCR